MRVFIVILSDSVEYNFRLETLNRPFADIIAKFYRKCHGTKNKGMRSKMDFDAKTVMKLCVAYKFFLHNHMTQTCFNSSKKMSVTNIEETKQVSRFSSAANIVTTK